MGRAAPGMTPLPISPQINPMSVKQISAKLHHVLDACAMLAYLHGEPGAAAVAASLSDRTVVCSAHAINLAEVFYDFLRNADERTARQAIAVLIADGLRERQDMGRRYWQRVARLKARGRISLADCCCLALTQHLGGTVLTSDHHEFDPLVPLGLCPILFIR